MKAGIVIDSWKRSVFEKALSDVGYEYEIHPGVTPGTLTITVEAASAEVLHPVVKAANEKSRRHKMN